MPSSIPPSAPDYQLPPGAPKSAAEQAILRCLPTYAIDRLIGQGVYGSVYLVHDEFKSRAVKVVPIIAERSVHYRSKDELGKRVSRDYEAVRHYYDEIKGAGILEIYDFHLVEDEAASQQMQAHLVILMEYCSQNLLDYVLDRFPLPIQQAVELMLDLVLILKRLCQCGDHTFLYTDVKPSNILFNPQGEMVLGDLGGIKRMNSLTTVASAQFTPSWSAPEFILQGAQPDLRAAVFSYGLVAYFIWEGQQPYEESDFIERVRRMNERGIAFERNDIPVAIQRLIKKCLQFEARARFADFGEIVAALQGKAAPDAESALDEKSAAKTTSEKKSTTPAIKQARFESQSQTRAQEKMPSGQFMVGSVGRSRHAPGTIWKEPHTHLEFVWVPAGTFLMGASDQDDHASDNERPRREVFVDGFWIGRKPITQGIWTHLMQTNPAHFQKGADYPVEQVTWHEVGTFIRKLTHKCGGRITFSLPTEIQWEYAARSAGLEQRYAGGNDLESLGWYSENSAYATHAVGRKASNRLGIFDMSGNVLEWCENVYQPDTGSGLKSTPLSGTASQRCVRGGSWYHSARHCRTTARRGVSSALRYTYLGFRLVRLP